MGENDFCERYVLHQHQCISAYILPEKVHLVDYNDYNLRPHANPTRHRKAGVKVELGPGQKLLPQDPSPRRGGRGIL